MGKALERHCGEVVHLGPVRPIVEVMAEFGNRFARRVLHHEFAYHHSRVLSRAYGRIFLKRLQESGPIDVIFAPAGSTQIASLETNIPIIYASDATFHLMHNYYGTFSKLSRKYALAADEIERRALQRAKMVTFPSDWAAQSAIDFYGICPKKVSMIPWGANMDHVPASNGLRASKDMARCSLLFLGVDWERKGGPIAYKVTDILRQRGVDATLTVCGCTPPEVVDSDWVKVIPHLDKEDPDQQAMLSRLLLEANFLLLPSRAECFGIAFCEASAHGTPSIAPATGGISSAIAEGKSGFLLPFNADAQCYADLILSVWSSPQRYQRLIEDTYMHYDTTVNWDTWGKELSKLINRLI